MRELPPPLKIDNAENFLGPPKRNFFPFVVAVLRSSFGIDRDRDRFLCADDAALSSLFARDLGKC